MPNGNWRHIIAGVSLGLIAWSGQAQESREQSESASNEQEAAPQQLPVPLPVVITESDEAVVSRQRKEEEAAEREESDLVAQQGMNTATQRMAKYALWQTWLVFVGTGVLIYTLWLTRQANRSAQDAVEVTRQMGKAQTRAYFSVHDVVIQDCEPFKNPTCAVSIQNSGNTPALIISHNLYIHCNDFPLNLDLPRPEVGIPPSTPLVGPGMFAKSKITSDFAISPGDWEQLTRKEIAIYFYGDLTYMDIFGQTHTLNYCFKHGGDVGVGHEEMTAMNIGNSATYFEDMKQDT